MKKVFLLFTILAAWTSIAESQTYGKLGAGLMVGEPSGISWKYRFDHANALGGAVGFLPDAGVRVDIDYLWHTHPFSNELFGVDWGAGIAVGPGRSDFSASRTGYFERGEEIGFGVRGVAELNYLIQHSPVDLFLDAAPLLILTPDSKTGLDTGFGMRVYF